MRHDAFTHSLFLAAGILLSISALLSLVSGALDVLGILYTIAFWLIFTSARSNKQPISGTGLFCGTVKASWIIGWIVTGIAAIAGIIVMFIPSADIGSFIDYSFSFGGEPFPADDAFDWAFSVFGMKSFIWLGVVLLVIAVLIALVNLLFTRRLLAFSRSVADSIDRSNAVIVEAEPTRKWMMALGIVSCLGLLGATIGSDSSMQSACQGASMILGSLWIKELPNFRYEDPVFTTTPPDGTVYASAPAGDSIYTAAPSDESTSTSVLVDEPINAASPAEESANTSAPAEDDGWYNN